jgi:hypothetical protein
VFDVAATEMIRDNLKPKYTRRLEVDYPKLTKPDILLSVYDGGLDEEDEDGRPRGRLIGSAKFNWKELLGKHNGIKRAYKVLQNSKNERIDKRLQRNHTSVWVKIIPPMPKELEKKKEWEVELRDPKDLSDEEYEKYQRRRRRRKRRRAEKRRIKKEYAEEVHKENEVRLAEIAVSSGRASEHQKAEVDQMRQYHSDSPDEGKELYESSRVRISSTNRDYPQMQRMSFNGGVQVSSDARSIQQTQQDQEVKVDTKDDEVDQSGTSTSRTTTTTTTSTSHSKKAGKVRSTRSQKSVLSDKSFSWFDDERASSSSKAVKNGDWFEIS